MKMQRLELVFLPCTRTPRKAYYPGIAPNPHNRTGLKIYHRKEETDGMTSKGDGSFVASTVLAHCPQEADKAPAGPFLRIVSV